MKKLTTEEIRAFQRLIKNNQDIVKLFEQWYISELEALPKASQENFGRSQGRCQVLQEIRDVLQNALEW